MSGMSVTGSELTGTDLTLVSDDECDSCLAVSVDETASLQSSIMHHHEENGRTYHAFNAGKYILPNDELEQDRLEVQAHVWQLTLGGELCLCPKNAGASSVLDMGTGTGIWAIDYADRHPDAHVIGVDLSPTQPSSHPPNCQFEIDDLEKPWTWGPERFDFIIGRCTSGSFSRSMAVIEEAYKHLQPGGYLELQELLLPAISDDGSLPPTSAISRWCALLSEGSARLGHPFDDAARYPDYMAAAGFEGVEYRTFKWPINAWPRRGKKDQRASLLLLGQLAHKAFDMGIEALCMAIFTRELGWTREETAALCEEVRREAKDTSIHAYWNIVVTYGMKPDKSKPQAVRPKPETATALAAPPRAPSTKRRSLLSCVLL